jgi:hypothetical protein
MISTSRMTFQLARKRVNQLLASVAGLGEPWRRNPARAKIVQYHGLGGNIFGTGTRYRGRDFRRNGRDAVTVAVQ